MIVCRYAHTYKRPSKLSTYAHMCEKEYDPYIKTSLFRETFCVVATEYL